MSKQSHKSKANLPAGGFVALGRDGGTTYDSVRGKTITKRDGSQLSGGILKRSRFDLPIKNAINIPSTSTFMRHDRILIDETRWRSCCEEVTVDPKTLLTSLDSAREKHKMQKVTRTICAAVRELIDYRRESNVWSVEPLICSSLMLFIKKLGGVNLQDEVIEALCSLLSLNFPEISPGFAFAPVLLYSAIKESPDWSWKVVDCFVEDSLHERYWVDRSSAGALVQNIITAFKTNIPYEAMFSASELAYPERYREFLGVTDRFKKQENMIQKWDKLVSQIKDVFERKGESVPKSLLKTMCTCCGVSTVRLMAARKMDSWLLNGKLQRYAMELLLWIASNTGRGVFTEDDGEALTFLLKLRALKSKQINTLFNVALREILNNDRSLMCSIAKLLLSNEFSANRFPYNMSVIHSLFSYDSRAASKILARELAQMLAAKEEYLKVSRTFLREFVRSLMRPDFDFALFTSHLFAAVVEDFSPSEVPTFLFKSLVDLCTILPFLVVTPIVRESAQQKRSKNGALTQLQSDALQKFYVELLSFFEVCTKFIATHHAFCHDNRVFVYSFYRVLYLAPMEYYVVDQWPSEADVIQYMRVIADVPLSEKLFSIIVEAGIDVDVPIDAADIIDVIENLTKRASPSTSLFGSSMIPISDCILLDQLFKVTSYKPPPTFHINASELPSLAVRTLYWKVWLIALIWACLNKEILIRDLYYKYPTLKIIMQMIITWDYNFPPAASGDPEKLRIEDERAANEEKMLIRRLEARLAGTEVSDADSKLINKLCSLEPTGVCRKPSESFMRDAKKYNDDLDLSRLLSECRDPDLLADIVKSQGNVRALPSVMALIESNSNAVMHLPLDCVCELFYNYIAAQFDESNSKISTEKLYSMKSRLTNALFGEATEYSAMQIIEYLGVRLSSSSPSERALAVHCFTVLLENTENNSLLPTASDPALFRNLHTIKHFHKFKLRLTELVALACAIERDLKRLSNYLIYLVEHGDVTLMHLVSHCVSQMVEHLKEDERDNSLRTKLIGFFEKYIKHVMRGSKENEGWAKVPDDVKKVKVYIERDGKEPCSLVTTSSAVSGMLQLLCMQWKKADEDATKFLMDFWFPANGNRPKVITGNGEEILPEWLRLKMLCTDDQRIVRVALDGIKPQEALKFVQCFGLTSYSYSKLLEVLDGDCTGVEKSALKDGHKISRFLRAYKLRGAKGGDKFLQRLMASDEENQIVKMEIDEEAAFNKDPPPSLSQTTVLTAKRALFKQLLPNEVTDIIIKAYEGTYTDSAVWSSVIFELSRNVECGRAVIALLKSIAGILINVNIAVSILNALMHLKWENPIIAEDIDSLYRNILNEASIQLPEPVKRILNSQDGKCTIDTESPSSPTCDSYSTEGILMRLASSPHIDDMVSRLVERYLDTYPGVVPFEFNGCEHGGVLEILFSSNTSAIHYLISLLPSRCPKNARSAVLDYLLQAHKTQFSSLPVLRTVFALLRANTGYSLQEKHCESILSYIFDEMDKNSKVIMTMFMRFLEEIAKQKGDFVKMLIERISTNLTFETSERRSRYAQIIIDAYLEHFPDSGLKGNKLIVGSLKLLKEQDRVVHNLIADLFTLADIPEANIDAKFSTLSQLALYQPKVVMRHLPVLSGRLSSTVQCSAGQLKQENYMAVLSFIPNLLIYLDPEPFKDVQLIQSFLNSYLRFFEVISLNSPRWKSLVAAVQLLCVKYFERNAEAARTFFVNQSDLLISLFVSHVTDHTQSMMSMISFLKRMEE